MTRLLYFAWVRERIGRSEEDLALPPHLDTVGDLLDWLSTRSPGHAAALLGSMAAAHERPAGPWHAEWHALPTLFGLASGALQEARALAEGLEVDAARMRANLDLTRGLLFADAAAVRLSAVMGRSAACALVDRGMDEVRRSGRGLLAVLADDPAVRGAGVDLTPAFDLGPATDAAGMWVDRAVLDAAGVRALL